MFKNDFLARESLIATGFSAMVNMCLEHYSSDRDAGVHGDESGKFGDAFVEQDGF